MSPLGGSLDTRLGGSPICKRCEQDGKECLYNQSQRESLDRVALIPKRVRLAKQSSSSNPLDDRDLAATEQREPLLAELKHPVLPNLNC